MLNCFSKEFKGWFSTTRNNFFISKFSEQHVVPFKVGCFCSFFQSFGISLLNSLKLGASSNAELQMGSSNLHTKLLSNTKTYHMIFIISSVNNIFPTKILSVGNSLVVFPEVKTTKSLSIKIQVFSFLTSHILNIFIFISSLLNVITGG